MYSNYCRPAVIWPTSCIPIYRWDSQCAHSAHTVYILLCMYRHTSIVPMPQFLCKKYKTGPITLEPSVLAGWLAGALAAPDLLLLLLAKIGLLASRGNCACASARAYGRGKKLQTQYNTPLSGGGGGEENNTDVRNTSCCS